MRHQRIHHQSLRYPGINKNLSHLQSVLLIEVSSITKITCILQVTLVIEEGLLNKITCYVKIINEL